MWHSFGGLFFVCLFKEEKRNRAFESKRCRFECWLFLLLELTASSKSQCIWDSASLEKWGHLWGSRLTHSTTARLPSPRLGCSVLSKIQGGQMSGGRVMKGPRRWAPALFNSHSPHPSEVISTQPGEDSCGAAHSPGSRAPSVWAKCNSQPAVPTLRLRG